MKLHTRKSCWQQDISRLEYAAGISKTTAFICLTAWLYYRSFIAAVLLVPIWLWHYRLWEKECTHKKIREFQAQFKETIQALSSSLSAGYSVENAWKETEKELKLLYNSESRIIKEMQVIVGKIRLNMPMDQIMEEFSERVDVEDVYNFTAVFITAKKSGGNMVDIIRNAVGQIGDKIDVKREIDTILAAKEYEFKVMRAVPYIIIAYMSLSFPEFMQTLYGNIIGAGVMTICLGIYLSACFLGTKIIKIEV